MLFNPELCEKVLAKLKTMTRRVEKPGDVALYDQKLVDGKVVDYIRAVVRNGRLLWEVGRTYAIQPGRGKKSLGRFLLTDIRKERLQEITPQGAKAEGVDPYIVYDYGANYVGYEQAFVNLWNTIHKLGERWEDDPFCWVLTMELVEPFFTEEDIEAGQRAVEEVVGRPLDWPPIKVSYG